MNVSDDGGISMYFCRDERSSEWSHRPVLSVEVSFNFPPIDRAVLI